MSITTNRQSLLKALNLTRPALASQAYIPAYTHFLVKDGWISTFNDISAIAVAQDIELERCLPGDLLIKTLGSFTANDVVIAEHPTESAVVLSSGRSKIKVPTLSVADFPLSWPKPARDRLVITSQILKGIELCLPGVGTNPTHPAQMGVTLDQPGNALALYSTDNYTISRYLTNNKVKLPGDAPVILPTFFCQQALALAKAFPDEELFISVLDGSLLLQVGKVAKLMTRMLVELQPLDFNGVLAKNIKKAAGKRAELPDGFDTALSRCLLILGAELDKVATLSLNKKTDQLLIKATTAVGEIEDLLDFDGDVPEAPVSIDPALVQRGGAACSHLTLGERALVLSNSDQSFIHLIAYCGV